MMKRVTPVLLGLALLFVGCRTFVPRTKMEFPENTPAAASQTEEVYGQVPSKATLPLEKNATSREVFKFCRELAILSKSVPSIGCLPLVSYDSHRPGPWVSELGMQIADEISEASTGWERFR